MARASTIISGIVRDPNGDPIVGARIFFTEGPVPLPDIAALTDKGGTFSLSAPVAGTYRLSCVAEGYKPADIEISVSSGQDQNLEIQMR